MGSKRRLAASEPHKACETRHGHRTCTVTGTQRRAYGCHSAEKGVASQIGGSQPGLATPAGSIFALSCSRR